MSHLNFLLILFLCILLQVWGQYSILSRHKPLFGDEENIDDDDDEDVMQPRISSGYLPKNSNLTKFTVSIRTRRPTGYWGDNHYCSGAIISKELVLTAAHCVVDGLGIVTRPHRINVVAGSPFRLKKAVTCLEYKVKKVIPNLKFQRTKGNDIAILVLADHIPKLNKNIKIISMQTKSPAVGTACITLGWGQLFWDGPFTNRQFYGNLTIVRRELCLERYGPEFTSDLLCVLNPANNFVDACRGDAGSPLICNDKLVGINSFTSMCAKTWPATYTDITKFLKWIQTASGGYKIRGCLWGNLLIIFLLLKI